VPESIRLIDLDINPLITKLILYPSDVIVNLVAPLVEALLSVHADILVVQAVDFEVLLRELQREWKEPILLTLNSLLLEISHFSFL